MNKIVKDAMALTVITLVAGLALGAVYDITKEPIAQQEALKKAAACQEVFADATTFEPLELANGLDSQLRQELDAAGFRAQAIDEIMSAEDESGNSLGYVVTVVSSEGYGGDIQFSMGIQKDGTVNGLSILAIGETAGLGMKANTPEFLGQFAGKNVETFVYTKNGAASDQEIDALSGATVTTNAMTNGVNAGLCAFHVLEGGE